MKKFISSINNPKSDLIYPMCLIATMLCAVQVITHIARLCIQINRLFTVEPPETVSYLDTLSGKQAMPPSIFALVIQLLLAVIPGFLCVLSFRGLTRPVQKKSLAITGGCLIATAAVLLSALPVAGAAGVAPVIIGACALIASAVLLITGRGQNVIAVGLLVLFALAVVIAKNSMPVEPLYAISVALGSAAVLFASQDPKMA